MKTKFLKRVLWLMIPLLTIFTTNAWGETATLTNAEIKAATAGNSYASRSVSSTSGTWTGKCCINTSTGYVQINKNANNYYFGSPTFSGGVTQVVIETNNSTASGRTFYLMSGTSTAQPTSGTYGSGSTAAVNGTATISVTGSPTSFYIYSNGVAYIKSVTVTYEAGSCNVDVTGGSAVILPLGSTDYSGGDWKEAGAPTSYPSSETSYTINSSYCVKLTKAADNAGIPANGLQFQASNGVLKLEGITSSAGVDIEISCSGSNGFSVALTGASTKTGQTGTVTISTTSTTADLTISKNTSNAGYLKYIKITPKAAACSGDPTIGAASLSGNFNSGGVTSLTNTITFATSSCNAYSGCAWVDYGFVWNTSTNPTTSNNKMQKGTSGTATSWNMTSPSTFSVGTTYYVRAYGKNGKSGAAFKYSSSTMSFTPRSVTFNSNGGSAVATKYIKSGGTITAPTAPTNGNYTFDGWYTDAGLTTPVNWSSTISENKTYYAKWSCSKHITVSWSAPSHGSIVVHQGNSADGPVLSSGAVLDNCEQAQIYVVCTPDDGYGVSSFSATNSQAHTGTTNILTFYTVNTTASSTITVTFAPMYTVTWMVNGSSYTTGDPTTQLSEGQHVTTLPTAPNPASYCGDKFVGWTTVQNYVHDSSPLYTTASGFPNATGNQIFYAVFADYDE